MTNFFLFLYGNVSFSFLFKKVQITRKNFFLFLCDNFLFRIIREITPPPKCGKLSLQNEKSVQKIRRILKKKNQKVNRESDFFFFIFSFFIFNRISSKNEILAFFLISIGFSAKIITGQFINSLFFYFPQLKFRKE